MNSCRPWLLALALGSGACTTEQTQPSAATCAGVRWELSAVDATGWIGNQPYYVLDEFGDAIVHTQCLCAPLDPSLVHAWLQAKVVAACEARADALGFDEDSSDCDEAVRAADPVAIETCEATTTTAIPSLAAVGSPW